MNTTAGQVANELRRIADIFDKSPDKVIIKPTLDFYHGYESAKETFVSLAHIFPRPFEKGEGYGHDQMTLTHESDALQVYASIDRSKVCTLKRAAIPAEYECEPLLSQIEEAAIDATEQF